MIITKYSKFYIKYLYQVFLINILSFNFLYYYLIIFYIISIILYILENKISIINYVKMKFFFYRELTSVQFEKVSDETLTSLTEYFDELVEQAIHLSDADVSYGVCFTNEIYIKLIIYTNYDIYFIY